MNKTVDKGRFADLERELTARRKEVSYQVLKRDVIESYIVGRVEARELTMQHIEMTKALRIGKKAEGQLKDLFCSILLPLQATLDATKAVVLETQMIASALYPEEKEAIEAETRAEKDRLGETFGNTVLKTLLISVGDFPNVKAVIMYPLLVGTVNSWRRYDFNFADKIIKSIKANEPDAKLKMTIEQLDIPVTVEQLRRN